MISAAAELLDDCRVELARVQAERDKLHEVLMAVERELAPVLAGVDARWAHRRVETAKGIVSEAFEAIGRSHDH